MIDRVGLVTTLEAAGVAYFVATMFPAPLPAFRDFGRRPEAAVMATEAACSWAVARAHHGLTSSSAISMLIT